MYFSIKIQEQKKQDLIENRYWLGFRALFCEMGARTGEWLRENFKITK